MNKSLLALTMLAISLVGCFDAPRPTADEKDQAQQERMTAEAQRQAGMPAITNYQEKKILKMIYELRDNEKLVNYCYLWSDMQGKLIYLGKCVGYGIPYATQYSNPQKVVDHYSGGGWLTMPQAEPNGLFMPSAAEGTWVMLLDEDGQPHPVYLEPRVIVSPFKLKI